MIEITKPNWDNVSITTPENWAQITKLLSEKNLMAWDLTTDQLKQLVNSNFDFIFNI